MSTSDNPGTPPIPENYATCTSCSRIMFQRHVDYAGRCPDCAGKHLAVPIPTVDGSMVHDNSANPPKQPTANEEFFAEDTTNAKTGKKGK